jgi:hypothetical protein
MRAKIVLVMAIGLVVGCFPTFALAACPTFHTLSNGSSADASQVMDNFNYILTCPLFTGRIGVLATPPAWSSGFDSSIDFGPNGALDTVSSSFDLDLADNLYNGSGGYTYKTSGPASMFRMAGNDFQWYEAGSAPAGTVAALSLVMHLDTFGNLTLSGNRVGVSATPPAWSAGFDTSIDFGPIGALDTVSSSFDLDLADNLYNGSGGYTYKTSGPAAMYRMAGNDFQWYAAGSASAGTTASLTLTMHLDSSGNLTIPGCLHFNGGQSGTCASDRRVKQNVRPFTDIGLAQISLLTPVSYSYDGRGGTPNDVASGMRRTGLIAQDVQKTVPDLVTTTRRKLNPADKKETALLEVRYGDLTFALINAVKELKAIDDDQKSQLARLRADEVAHTKEFDLRTRLLKRQLYAERIQNKQIVARLNALEHGEGIQIAAQ